MKNSKENIAICMFSGAPDSFEYFVPHPGIAKLAGIISNRGNKVVIKDYDSFNYFKLFLPQNSHQNIRAIFDDKNCSNILGEMNSESKKIKTSYNDNACSYIVEDLINHIDSCEISIVVFNSWLGDSLKVTLEICSQIKKRRNVTCILGGAPISSIGIDILRFCKAFDYVTFSYSEKSFPLLLDYIENEIEIEISTLINTAYKDSRGDYKLSRIDREVCPSSSKIIPIYDKKIYTGIENKIKIIFLDEDRGCFNKCPFCSHGLHKKSYGITEFRLENLVCLIDSYIKKYGVKAFRLSGSSPDHKFLNELSKKIIEKEIDDIMLASFCSLDNAMKLDMDLVKKAGFSSLFIGVEGFDNKNISTFFNKKINLKNISTVGEKLEKKNIHSVLSFIYPQPYEYKKLLQSSLDKLNFSKSMTSLSFSFPKVFPSTEWWIKPNEFGIKIKNKDDYLHHLVFDSELVDDDFSINCRGYDCLKKELVEVKDIAGKGKYKLRISNEEFMFSELLGMDAFYFQKLQKYIFSTFDVDCLEVISNKLRWGYDK